MTALKSAVAIIAKDVRLEARRVENLATMAIFAVLVVVIFVFAGDPTPEDLSRLGPGALWVSLLFSGVIGFQRWFAQEEKNGALQGLLLTPVDRGALFIGKWVGATLFLLAIDSVTNLTDYGFHFIMGRALSPAAFAAASTAAFATAPTAPSPFVATSTSTATAEAAIASSATTRSRPLAFGNRT